MRMARCHGVNRYTLLIPTIVHPTVTSTYCPAARQGFPTTPKVFPSVQSPHSSPFGSLNRLSHAVTLTASSVANNVVDRPLP